MNVFILCIVIILKTKWSDQDLKVLPKVIKFFKDTNQIFDLIYALWQFQVLRNPYFQIFYLKNIQFLLLAFLFLC